MRPLNKRNFGQTGIQIRFWSTTPTPTVVTGTVLNPTFAGTETFTINGVSVALSTTTLAAAIVAINTAAVPHVLASNSSGHLVLTNSVGGAITIVNTSGTFIAEAGLAANTPGNNGSIITGYIVKQKGANRYKVSNDAGSVTDTVILQQANPSAVGQGQILVTNFAAGTEHAYDIAAHLVKTFEDHVYVWQIGGSVSDAQHAKFTQNS